MANLTITRQNVGLVDDLASYAPVIAGEALTQGQPVYRSAEKAFRASAGAADTSQAFGICLTPAAIDQPAIVVFSGKMVIGAALSPGRTYVLSPTSGLIMPETDLAGGDFSTILGSAISPSVLEVNINITGWEV